MNLQEMSTKGMLALHNQIAEKPASTTGLRDTDPI